MEGEERHSVGSAPALGTASTLAAESPNVAKAAAARSLFDGRAIPATAATKTTPAAVNVAPPMSHLPSPAKEGSLRGGNLFQSIEQGTKRSSRRRRRSKRGKGLNAGGRDRRSNCLRSGSRWGGRGGHVLVRGSVPFFDGDSTPLSLSPLSPRFRLLSFPPNLKQASTVSSTGAASTPP